VITSFADSHTRKVWLRESTKRFSPALQRLAHRKLMILEAANFLHDLRIPPGNRLEPLTGDRVGQHSIRINDQWRICFRWFENAAHDGEIVDYH
jgi:proteic killer suppression protein